MSVDLLASVTSKSSCCSSASLGAALHITHCGAALGDFSGLGVGWAMVSDVLTVTEASWSHAKLEDIMA